MTITYLLHPDGVWRAPGVEDVPTQPPGAWTPNVMRQVQAAWVRPAGPDYQRYEDIYVTGDSVPQAMGRATAGKIVTFPDGEFVFQGFEEGYMEGLRLGSAGSPARGIAGSGRGTVFSVAPHTASTAVKAEGDKTSGTVATNIIGTDLQSNYGAYFGGFTLRGTDQDTRYNGLRVGRCAAGSVVESVFFDGAAPGDMRYPPGETFQLNVWRADHTTLRDCEFSGLFPGTNTEDSASPFGWNSCSDALVERTFCFVSNGGQPTFWDTNRVETNDLWSVRMGSGGGVLGGVGLNHENVRGRVRHNRLRTEQQGTYADTMSPWNRLGTFSGSNGSHMTFQNGSTGNNPDCEIHDPVNDKFAHASGGFSIMIGDSYLDPITRGPQTQTSVPRVFKGGVELTLIDANQGGSGTADTHYVRYH